MIARPWRTKNDVLFKRPNVLKEVGLRLKRGPSSLGKEESRLELATKTVSCPWSHVEVTTPITVEFDAI